MKLDRSIVFLDTETTGVDPVRDRIVELGMVVLKPTMERKRCRILFNPGIPIPAEATAVHGISDGDVALAPRFSEYAERVAGFLKGKDLGGYNLRFDLPIVDEELRRCGHKIDLVGSRVIDAMGIYKKKEPRDLTNAVRQFCGREHDGAHGALADAEASADVLLGQLTAYEDLAAMSLDDLAEYSRLSENRPADLAGKLYYDDAGVLRFGFGKWVDQKVAEHLDYADWMIHKGQFPGSTVEVLRTVVV